MPEEITSSLETIEFQAEKILQDARTRANEILREAREESKRALSSNLPLEEVKAECDRITDDARLKAKDKINQAAGEAAKIRASADTRIDGVVERIVRIITGAASA